MPCAESNHVKSAQTAPDWSTRRRLLSHAYILLIWLLMADIFHLLSAVWMHLSHIIWINFVPHPLPIWIYCCDASFKYCSNHRFAVIFLPSLFSLFLLLTLVISDSIPLIGWLKVPVLYIPSHWVLANLIWVHTSISLCVCIINCISYILWIRRYPLS